MSPGAGFAALALSQAQSKRWHFWHNRSIFDVLLWGPQCFSTICQQQMSSFIDQPPSNSLTSCVALFAIHSPSLIAAAFKNQVENSAKHIAVWGESFTWLGALDSLIWNVSEGPWIEVQCLCKMSKKWNFGTFKDSSLPKVFAESFNTKAVSLCNPWWLRTFNSL